MGKNLLRSIITLAWLVASCNPLATPQSTAVPTATYTLEPTTTPTSRLTATNTVEPTATPTQAIGTPIPTPGVVERVMAASQARILGTYPSPDGQWRAEVVIYDCVSVGGVDENAYEELRLIRVDREEETIIDTQLQYCGGLGAFGLAGLFWSLNSRYFYYTNAREGVPDGCNSFWQRPIVRLDVTNQDVEYLGGGPLSPDGTKFVTWEGQELILWDVNRSEMARTQAIIPDAVIGQVAWSPDTRALIYLQATLDEYGCFPAGKSYIVRLELPTLEHTLLLESETPSFTSVAWDAPDRLRLFEVSGHGWEFDLATGELTAVH